MSLIPGNIEVLAFAFQADKDTPAAAPVIAFALEDCQLDPNPTFITTPESDASALEPNDVIVGAQPGGTFKKYLRPNEEDFLLYALLGKVVDAAVGAPYYGQLWTHASQIDPAAPFATPYLTCWDIWPGVQTVRYDGCRISKLVAQSQAGAAWDGEYTLVASRAEMGVAQPSLANLFVDELPFTWPDVSVLLNNVHEGIVNRASLTIDRGTSYFPGDNGLESLDIPNGLAAVTGQIEAAFQDDDLARAANTGSTSGTELTTAVFSMPLAINIVRLTHWLKFALASAQIKNLKTDLKTDGSPAVSTFDFKSRRTATLANYIATNVRNAKAQADRVP